MKPTFPINLLSFLRRALSFIGVLLAAELLLWATVGPDLGRWLILDERNQLFMHDAELGWTGRPSASGIVEGAKPIAATLNSDGFRDQEFVPEFKTDVLFLGDSFVWGFDAEDGARFTDLLRAENSNLQIKNLGVSGYGTDQQYLLLRKYFSRLQPRLVVLVVNLENDRDDNSSTERYFGYFKPAFVQTGAALTPIGIPVPQGLRYHLTAFHPLLRMSCLARVLAGTAIYFDRFRRIGVPDVTQEILQELIEYTSKNNSAILLAFITMDDALKTFCKSTPHFKCLALPPAERFGSYGGHWTPGGHKTIAEAIAPHIRELLRIRN
jgi:lysophospholipase L1-like esterase